MKPGFSLAVLVFGHAFFTSSEAHAQKGEEPHEDNSIPEESPPPHKIEKTDSETETDTSAASGSSAQAIPPTTELVTESESESKSESKLDELSRRVVILALVKDPSTLHRVIAEFRSADFEVIEQAETEADSVTSPALLFELANDAQCGAAIVIRESKDEVEIWIADAVTNKTVMRTTSSTGADDDLIALSALELLRASRLQALPPQELEPPPNRDPAVPTSPITLPVDQKKSPWAHLELAASLGLAIETQGAPVTSEFQGRLGWFHRSGLGASLIGGFAPGGSIQTEQEVARLARSFVGVFSDYRTSARPFNSRFGLGLLAVSIATDGETTTAGVLTRSQAWVPAAALTGDIGVNLARLRLALGSTVSAALSASQVRFEGTPVATIWLPHIFVGFEASTALPLP